MTMRRGIAEQVHQQGRDPNPREKSAGRRRHRRVERPDVHEDPSRVRNMAGQNTAVLGAITAKKVKTIEPPATSPTR